MKTVQGKNKTGKADVALNLISKLYGIEVSLKGKTAESKYLARQEKSQVIIDKLHGWVIDNKDKVPPKNKLGEAMTYGYNQAPKLIIYLKGGR